MLKVMSTDSDTCTAPPDHQMACSHHHFEVWAKILKLLFSVSPQLEKSVQTFCKYAILQEFPKKIVSSSALHQIYEVRRHTHSAVVNLNLPLAGHHSPLFNCLNRNTTTLNTAVHKHMSLTNLYKNSIEQTSAAFCCFAITRQRCGTYAAPGIWWHENLKIILSDFVYCFSDGMTNYYYHHQCHYHFWWGRGSFQ